jgi:AcrR family transcriptional regulator
MDQTTPQSPAAPRRATVERHGELRAALVAAAERIIEADGVEGVRARALAESAGCSVGAIYNVVPDLDALVLAANARTLAAIDESLRAVFEVSSGIATPSARLVGLGLAYLRYASAHPQRWSALFAHRMAGGGEVPSWYRAQQAAMFVHVEAPLAQLRPALSASERALLARSLFSAVHGIVSLGLSGTLVSLPLEVQKAQLALVIEAIARGLADAPS